jgi:hypothetical protein
MLLIIFLVVPTTLAHRMTEQYIPIGQSPGVSGKYSTIGVIQNYNPVTHAIMIKSDSGMVTYMMDEHTRIYVDRNQSKRTNLKGSYKDCTPGRRVEVMHRFDKEGIALWVKVAETN